MSFYITLDQQIDQYQRTVYSFFDMFGFLGGVLGILKSLGLIFVNIISTKLFYSSIVSRLYYIEAESRESANSQNLHKQFNTGLQNHELIKNKSKVAPKTIQNEPSFELAAFRNKTVEESKFDSSLNIHDDSKKYVEFKRVSKNNYHCAKYKDIYAQYFTCYDH